MKRFDLLPPYSIGFIVGLLITTAFFKRPTVNLKPEPTFDVSLHSVNGIPATQAITKYRGKRVVKVFYLQLEDGTLVRTEVEYTP